MHLASGEVTEPLLLHKRRVSSDQERGLAPVLCCTDCHAAFRSQTPKLCKYKLANDLWLGRWDPLFRSANLSHQMLLALGRVVTTKVVLRPDGHRNREAQDDNKWDFLFHQSGMIGSAIIFPNATCGEALQRFPPEKVNDTFAVSFLTSATNGKSS